MTESDKLAALRHKLISKRRALVESLQKVPNQQLTGDSIARIQAGVDAVDRAIEDERRAESTVQSARRTATSSGDQ